MTERALFAVVLVAAAVAFALPFRQPDCNTGAHFALVQSLANGSARIDPIHGESCDISWWHGHYYANKAPGLALVTLPWYVVAKAAGLLRADPEADAPYPAAMRAMPRRDLWLMGLWGAVLPALGLLVVMRRVADRLAPGTGVAAAAILGVGSLVLPFSSLYFSHVLASFCGFAAFALVLGARGAPRRLAAAGLLAGAGILIEYPSALLAILLGVAVVVTHRGRPGRALAVFAAGAAVGPCCLLVFDWLAFGSPFHLSYVGAVAHPGLTGHDVLGANSAGFFGVTTPSAHRLVAILVGGRGLLTLAPVFALVPLGWVVLWRRGRRREAGLLATVVCVFCFYNACYYSPLGGATPGPRFLVVVLPFAVAALAPLLAARPWPTLLLSVPGVVLLLAAHITQPLISKPYSPGSWWTWIREGSFTSTVLAPGSHAALPVAPVVAAAACALAAAGASLLRQTGAAGSSPPGRS